MIKTVEMYTAVCDRCGWALAIMHSPWGAEDAALNARWWFTNDYHYCPDCYEEDDDGEYRVKEKI